MGGEAGSGKTSAAYYAAEALGFICVPCGPQTTKSEIYGFTMAGGDYAGGYLQMALKIARSNPNGCVIGWDEYEEINRAM
jgi:hypothetical protein